MTISIIETYSSEHKPYSCEPYVAIVDRQIKILPFAATFSKMYILQDEISITIPEVFETNNLRVHLVEDISTGEPIIVTDIKPAGHKEWEPDASKHVIIHNLIYGILSPSNTKLEDDSISIYLRKLPHKIESEQNG